MLLKANCWMRPVDSELPGGALYPRQLAGVIWPAIAAQFSGGTRAPLQNWATTGELVGMTRFAPVTRLCVVSVTIELLSVSCVPAGMTPERVSSVRMPTSQ